MERSGSGARAPSRAPCAGDNSAHAPCRASRRSSRAPPVGWQRCRACPRARIPQTAVSSCCVGPAGCRERGSPGRRRSWPGHGKERWRGRRRRGAAPGRRCARSSYTRSRAGLGMSREFLEQMRHESRRVCELALKSRSDGVGACKRVEAVGADPSGCDGAVYPPCAR